MAGSRSRAAGAARTSLAAGRQPSSHWLSGGAPAALSGGRRGDIKLLSAECGDTAVFSDPQTVRSAEPRPVQNSAVQCSDLTEIYNSSKG